MIYNVELITLNLLDRSIFQVVSRKVEFTDKKENFRGFQTKGIREAYKEKNLTGTNVLMIL